MPRAGMGHKRARKLVASITEIPIITDAMAHRQGRRRVVRSPSRVADGKEARHEAKLVAFSPSCSGTSPRSAEFGSRRSDAAKEAESVYRQSGGDQRRAGALPPERL